MLQPSKSQLGVAGDPIRERERNTLGQHLNQRARRSKIRRLSFLGLSEYLIQLLKGEVILGGFTLKDRVQPGIVQDDQEHAIFQRMSLVSPGAVQDSQEWYYYYHHYY